MAVKTNIIETDIIVKLEKRAKKIRKNIIKMIQEAGSGHPGGSLSIVEILVALYFNEMKYDVKNPAWDGRDRFVLSKGHACAGLYATLAEAGFFSAEELLTFRKLGSRLQGHPAFKLPGIDFPSGSLGHGLSVANGMALAGKLDRKNFHIYVLLGDGELQEGQVWEAAMASSHHKLDSLVAVIDRNGFQLDGRTEDIKSLEPLAEKWQAFGWNTIEIDGHDLHQIMPAFEKARNFKGKPTAIICKTVKGKGIPFMENNNAFHGKAPTPQEAEDALAVLGCEEAD